MKDVLDEIVAWKRIEVAQAKAVLPLRQLEQSVRRQMDEENTPPPSMSKALLASDTGIIAEMKRRSPSKGWISEGAKPDVVPLAYEHNGATAVSILYKNFVIDAYQLFQARRCGASAVLLIAACLRKDECRSLLRLAHDLGLEVLLETHDEKELDYVDLEPDMCGVNNRHLGTFVTDVVHSFRMARLLPEPLCKVSESGISDPQTVLRLREAGYRGFLIGESLMKTEDPGQALAAFVECIAHSA